MASRSEDDPLAEIPSLRGYRYIDTEGIVERPNSGDGGRYIDSEDPLVQTSDLMEPYSLAAEACNTRMAAVLQLLTSERRNNATYDRAWLTAERMLQDDDTVRLQGSPPECSVAMLALCTQWELHEDFARSCREASTWQHFPYKSLYCLLARCIHTVNNKPGLHQNVYRGTNFRYDRHQFRSGATVFLRQFLPCTTDPDLARQAGGTVIQFPRDVAAGVGVRDFAGGRDEVLVYPWSTFVVRRLEGDLLELQNTGPFANNVPFAGDLAMLGVSFLGK